MERLPDRLGDYRVGLRLGEGGMGEVFEAQHVATGERVALKRLIGLDPTRLYRFKREFRAMVDNVHPNLVRLFELVSEAKGATYFTMELVEGRPFDEWVRRRTPPGHSPNPTRLVRVMRQLVEGVRHLHDRGTIHRDLKPSNVLVTREGRVVILDFGLIAEGHAADTGITSENQLIGTPAYMAPEQGRSSERAAVDLYALGVILFRCLTGELPFDGLPLEVLVAKQSQPAPDPRTRAPDAPAELCVLCMDLLAIDASARPSCSELLARLPGTSGGESNEHASAAASNQPRHVFVGRDAELERLHAALQCVAEGRPRTVFVRGASGIGKSSLLAHFFAQASDRHDVLLLRGRCLERESVPYKGVDALIDALSAYLRRLPDLELVRYLPRHHAPLATIFPILSDLWPETRRGKLHAQVDLHHQRRLGIAALRELLARLAEERLVVLHVEDFQWADLDGAQLLSELARPPDAPRVLLVVSFRDEVAGRECLRELTSSEALAEREVDDIVLGPLSERESIDLALALDPAATHGERLDESIARAAGSPFYLRELLRAGRERDASPSSSLDAVVARRILMLGAAPRRTLTAIAVARGPLHERLVLASGHRREHVDELIELGLVVRDEIAGTLDTSHDRIREVAIGELDLAELRELNLELAHLLAVHQGSHERLAELFERGGAPELALEHVEHAAKQAADSLGFARAVELYRRALRLLGEREPERRARLEAALADQMINLGRAREAAELFLGLVERSPDPMLALAYRRQAADHLIKSGQLDRGLDVLATALAAFGERLPRRPWPSIVALIGGRLRLALRGSSYVLRSADALEPRAREHLDTLLAGTLGLMSQEMLTTTALHARLLRAALDAGEPYHLACALMWEMILWLNAGFDRRARHFLGEVRELAGRSDDPMVQGIAAANEASYTYLSRRWSEANADWERLIARIDDIPQLGWLRSMRTFEAHSKLSLGAMATLRSHVPAWTDEALASGSRQEAAEMLAFASLVDTFVGDLADARTKLDEARRHWQVPRYTFPELYLDIAEVPLHLAAGEPWHATALIERSLASARRWQVHRIVLAREELLDLHARSFASLALARRDAGAAKLARASARKLARNAHPASRGRAAMIAAALAEQPEQARAAWQRAHAEFARADMRAHAAAAALRLAALADADAALTEAGVTYFAREGIAEVERALQVLAPAPPWLPAHARAGESG